MKARNSCKRASDGIRTLAVIGVFCLTFAVAAPALSADDFSVTLLGTGMPVPSPDRFGNSTLIEAGGQRARLRYGARCYYPFVAEADSSRQHRRTFPYTSALRSHQWPF